jgi:hypothetical protein
VPDEYNPEVIIEAKIIDVDGTARDRLACRNWGAWSPGSVPRFGRFEFAAYVQRGFFYNATARTVDGYLGLIFRRDPVLVLPGESSALHPVLRAFVNDVDLRGTTLDAFARHTVNEVISVGRC